MSDYSHLEQLETCKLTFKEHEVLFKNDIETNLDNLSNFNYYDNHEFHKLIKSPSVNVHKISSIFHTNISSVSKNIENVEILLDNLDFKFDVIALSETWHTNDNDKFITQIKLEGFHNYSGQIGSNRKGGCGVFIADYLSYVLRDDINKSYKSTECEFEAHWVELDNNTKQNTIIIGVVYNHPRKNPSTLLDYLQTTLYKLTRENI